MPAADVTSYGGGVQSTALLVLAATGRFDCGAFVFSNVGDDSEHPSTLAYIRDVARPYAEVHDIELAEVHRIPVRGRFAGQVETLFGRLTHPDEVNPSIPVRRYAGGPPLARSCTADFKVRTVARWVKARGFTVEAPANLALGISVDEIERARPGVDERQPTQVRTYPLLDMGLHRSDCRRIIAEAGIPVPPKSSCWFCPFHDVEAWRALRAETPDLWAKSVDLERSLNEKRAAVGKEPVFLTRYGVPLDQAIDDQQALDLGLDGCDSGWCMT